MSENNVTVGIFASHTDAEEAVKRLSKIGYDMHRLSIIGADYEREEHPVGYYNMGDRARFWGREGAFWGSLWGLIMGGSGLFLIPALGTVFVLGPLVALLVSALEGAAVVGGISVFGAALYSLGIPKDSIINYETELKAHKYLLISHGSKEEVDRARDILKTIDQSHVATHYAESELDSVRLG